MSKITIDDEMYDIEAVADGAWVPGPYGPDDQLGTYNEVTPEKRAAAWSLLAGAARLQTINLGDVLFNGYPGFGDRDYQQQLVIAGYAPPEGYAGIANITEPMGSTRLSFHEERVQTTYNIASKVNGLLHCGVGDLFYNGFRGRDIARDHGTSDLDVVSWGVPLVTRGFLIDVVGLKAERGEDVFSSEGRPVLEPNYRVTLEDLEAAVRRQELPAFEAGDAIMLRTGWNNLVRPDPEKFLSGSPGPWLRETRWLASHRPALLGIDSWVWGTVDPDATKGFYNACHQELNMRFGIRFGEGFQFEELADAGVDRFVLSHTPLRAEGATSSSVPALAIAALGD
ncbi:MAG: cyclase family protein [bacterium]|nr:cyclase family protein [bacterium]